MLFCVYVRMRGYVCGYVCARILACMYTCMDNLYDVFLCTYVCTYRGICAFLWVPMYMAFKRHADTTMCMFDAVFRFLVILLFSFVYMQAITTNAVAMFTGAFCFFCIWSLQSLCGYHMYLVAIGQTTNENLRRTYDESPNPYHQGCGPNCVDVCWEQAASLLEDGAGMV